MFSINAFQTKLQGRLARLVMALMIRSIQDFGEKVEFSARNIPLPKFVGLWDAEYHFADSLLQIPLRNLWDAGSQCRDFRNSQPCNSGSPHR